LARNKFVANEISKCISNNNNAGHHKYYNNYNTSLEFSNFSSGAPFQMSSADGGTVTWKTLVAEGRDVNEFSSLKIFSNFTIIFGLSGGLFSSFEPAAAAVLELGGEDIRHSIKIALALG
jgi:hypothetical protein